MTGQELRHELSQVNFGVKPTDREVPDGLAKGIVRFFAQKKGITVNMETLGLPMDMEEGEEGKVGASRPTKGTGQQSHKFPGSKAAPSFLREPDTPFY
jgi:hypothetical protein